MRYHLGVDLGTTYTAAAVRLDDRVDVVRLGGGRSEIPSLVFVHADGTVLIGEAAERRGATEPTRLAREFKRRVGDPVPTMIGGAPYSAHALMARLLEQVLLVVEAQQQGPPATVTVTYPANWGPYKRELFHQAVHMADLTQVVLCTEPQAAAVRYAAGENVRPGETIAVYDLGGGTFDAAVLRKTDAGFVPLGQPEGIEHLGGIDFDEAVFTHVLTTLGAAAAGLRDPDGLADEQVAAAVSRLRRDCVHAKEALSFDTDVTIPVALPRLHTQVRLNRSEFEAMITPAVGDTVAAFRRALRAADTAPADLKAVLLAGGSSRIPLVSQLLTAELGRPVFLAPDPEHSVAIGAALLTASTASVADAPVHPIAGPTLDQPTLDQPTLDQPTVAQPAVGPPAAPPPPASPPPPPPPPRRWTRARRVRALLTVVALVTLIGVTTAVVRYRAGAADGYDVFQTTTPDASTTSAPAGPPDPSVAPTTAPPGPEPSPTAVGSTPGPRPARSEPPPDRAAPPPPIVRRQQPYLLISNSARATWRSGAGTLPFPGQPGDDRGGATVEYYVLEDGTAPEHVTTHPQWVDYGWIDGDFPVPGSIMNGDRFRATVGFVIPQSGTSAGEVDFVVLAISSTGRVTELSRIHDTGRDGTMHTFDIDLTRVRGYPTIRIRAEAGATAAQDWAAWVNPRVEH